MYLLYSLLLTVGFVALLPWFALDAFRTRKYITGLGQRLGKLPNIGSADRPLIWLHCVSVGETEAARPLVQSLQERFPSHRLVISTTTVTGQKIAQEAFGRHAAAVFYFPIDWAWTVRRVLRNLQPAAVLIMETELWPHLLRECHRRSIPVALINGRISGTSFGRYQMIRPFIKGVLARISIALMQSEPDAARIRDLGMPSERILMPGNLKFDSAESSIDHAVTAKLRDRFGLDRDARLIVAASTHDPEEQVILDSFRQLKISETASQARLLIAPRHPERFGEVATLLEDSGFTWSRRSSPEQTGDRESEVVLLDSIGELRAIYPLADIAFVGGSIAPHGGHNVLEPAARGVCVVTGPHTQNFAAITKAMLTEEAIVQLPPAASTAAAAAGLSQTLHNLLSHDSLRHEIGKRAKVVCDRNRGATEKTLQVIASLLEARKATGASIPYPELSVNTGQMNPAVTLALTPFGALYGAAMKARRALYGSGRFRVHELGAPVISVGNLTMGGTGKTPLVEWIARELAETGVRVCILTRGYGRQNAGSRTIVSDGQEILADAAEAGDEPLLLAEKLQGQAAVISDADRVRAAAWALEKLHPDVFILDDGYQHLRVARDLNILTLDATNPWGNGKLLPAGMLRESPAELQRADCIVITRADDPHSVAALRSEITARGNHAPVFDSRMKLSEVRASRSDEAADVTARSKASRFAAFCGLGNPESFFSLLRRSGYQLALAKAFRDHYRYQQTDVDQLEHEARAQGAQALLTTAKDEVKLRSLTFSLPCLIADIEMEIDQDSSLRALVEQAVRPAN